MRNALRDELYIAAIESSDLAFVTTDLAGTITSWSRGARDLFGHTEADVLGADISIIVPADRRAEPHANIGRVRDGGLVADQKTTRLNRDGRLLHVSLSVAPIRNAGGQLIGASGIYRDISEQILSEEKFRLAVDACPSGMMMVDDRGTIVLINSEIERMFGYAREELIGRPVELLLPARAHSSHAVHRENFTRNPETRRMGSGRDLFARRKDGSEFQVEVGLNPIDTHAGVLILGVVIDITKRKRAEEKFRLLVDASPSGIVLIDSSGRIVIVNAEIEGLFGYGREELIDQPSSLLVPAGLRVRGADHSAGFGHWPELRKAVVTRDAVARRKDGSEFPVEVRLNPIQMEDQFLVLCVLIDITERKRVEGLKDEFVSTVSHELRTPLTSIAASLGLLTGNTAIALPTSALRLISIAHSNSQRLVRLINDILDIEKMESGEIIFDMRRVAVSALLEQTIEANRGLAESKQVGLAFIDPPAEIYVNADFRPLEPGRDQPPVECDQVFASRRRRRRQRHAGEQHGSYQRQGPRAGHSAFLQAPRFRKIRPG